MAYDLLFRKQIPVDVSRHPAPGSPTVNAPTMSLISVGAAYLFVSAVRALVKPEVPMNKPHRLTLCISCLSCPRLKP